MIEKQEVKNIEKLVTILDGELKKSTKRKIDSTPKNSKRKYNVGCFDDLFQNELIFQNIMDYVNKNTCRNLIVNQKILNKKFLSSAFKSMFCDDVVNIRKKYSRNCWNNLMTWRKGLNILLRCLKSITFPNTEYLEIENLEMLDELNKSGHMFPKLKSIGIHDDKKGNPIEIYTGKICKKKNKISFSEKIGTEIQKRSKANRIMIISKTFNIQIK